MTKWRNAVVVLSVFQFMACAAMAGPVSLFTSTLIASAANPSPVGATGLGPGGAVGGVGGPIQFAMPFDGLFTLVLQDCCLVGDVYQAFVDGASVGFTSAVPIGGPVMSEGAFSVALLAGSHTYDVNDQLLSYIGFSDPHGGGIVGQTYSPAGVTAIGTATAPEPATVLLLGLALSALGVVRRARP